MSPELQPLGRALLLLGVILAGIGVVLLAGPKIPWLGRLPGDIAIQREHFSLYIPLTTCIVASLIISVLLWLFRR